MSTESETYRIPSSRMAELQAKVAKLNRRAARLGFAPFAATTIEHLIVPVLDQDRHPTGRVREFDIVRIDGSAPVVAGHVFIARVEHHAIGNIISRAPGQTNTALPHDLRTASPRCDHCRTDRRRNDTFVLLEFETNAIKRIGRNCLADYLRTKDAAQAISIFSMLHELRAACGRSDDDDEGGGFGPRFDGFEMLSFLAATASVIRNDGWVSSRAAREDDRKRATAGTACWLLSPSFGEQEWARRERARLAPTRDDITLAEQVVAWATTLAGRERLTDYEHNLSIALRLGFVTDRTAGLVASAVMAHRREVERMAEARRPARPPSTHFGAIGSRYDLALEVAFTREIESDFGVKTILGFVDAEGRRFKWFATGPKTIKVGDKIAVRGTVKKHEAWNNQAETVLTRCSILEAA